MEEQWTHKLMNYSLPSTILSVTSIWSSPHYLGQDNRTWGIWMKTAFWPCWAFQLQNSSSDACEDGSSYLWLVGSRRHILPCNSAAGLHLSHASKKELNFRYSCSALRLVHNVLYVSRRNQKSLFFNGLGHVAHRCRNRTRFCSVLHVATRQGSLKK